MPRTKRITEKKLQKVIREIIESDDKDASLKAIKLYKDIQKEAMADKQTQREKVIHRVVSDKELQKLIGFKPHPKQQEILNCKSSDVVICAGRQGGKTIYCAYKALKTLLEDNKAICLVAPTYTLTGRVMDYLKIWIGKYFKGEMRIVNRPFPKIVTRWGSYLDGKSTEKPEQILGKGYDLIIIDECARISESHYHTYIVEASGTKLGNYIYISTPRGRNWFWRLWRRAKERGGAFQWKSIESPYFTKEKWKQEKKVLPEIIFRQEYEAEFLESAMVFQGIDSCLKDYPFPREYNPKHLYVMGLDLGRYEAWTVGNVMDLMTNQLVFSCRFQGNWAFQKKRIISIAEKYGHCPIWIDATSITVGDAYVEELSDAGFSVMGYKIHSNISKRELIEKLVVLIQNVSISLPKKGTEASNELITEIRAFTYSISPSGLIRYHAPQGEYDDSVIALALACFELDSESLAELESEGDQTITPPKNEF